MMAVMLEKCGLCLKLQLQEAVKMWNMHASPQEYLSKYTNLCCVNEMWASTQKRLEKGVPQASIGGFVRRDQTQDTTLGMAAHEGNFIGRSRQQGVGRDSSTGRRGAKLARST